MEHERYCINRQVKNNEAKFDIDFSFQLTKQEFDDLRCKNSTSSWNRLVYLPFPSLLTGRPRHELSGALFCLIGLIYEKCGLKFAKYRF